MSDSIAAEAEQHADALVLRAQAELQLGDHQFTHLVSNQLDPGVGGDRSDVDGSGAPSATLRSATMTQFFPAAFAR